MVRLVEHYQIPLGRFQNSLDTAGTLQRIDAGDQAVVLGEGVRFAVGHVPFRPEDLEIEVEDLVQLAVPVVHQPGGHDHQGPRQFAAAGQFAQHQGRFDRLAQPHLVGHEEAAGRGRRHAVRENHLMRQEVDACRSQSGRILHQRQGMGFNLQPGAAQPLRAFRDAGQDLLGAAQGDAQRLAVDLAFARGEEGADVAVGRSADDDALAKIRVNHALSRLVKRCLAGNALRQHDWTLPE